MILTTGNINPKDVVVGLETGANLYIKKSYTPEELNAHIIALFNTINNSMLQMKSNILSIGKYTFEPKKRLLIYNDSDKKVLTARESQILELLLKNKGEIVKRADILDKFWENWNTEYASSSLDVFITKLRNYLAKDASITITNIKATGLMLDFD